MRLVAIIFFSTFFFVRCQKIENNKVSRIPLEESETFYLSQVPRKIQVFKNSLFVHDRYHQVVGVYDLGNGKIIGLFKLKDVDLQDLYLSVSSTDSLVWQYDSIADLPFFIDGNRVENFLVQDDTLLVMLSLTIPYKDADKGKESYRYWHRHNFIVAFDMTSGEYSWRRLDTEGYDVTKTAVGALSNFYLTGDYLLSPMNMVNDSLTKVMVFKKANNHLYKFNGFIPFKSKSAIKLTENLFCSEIINYQDFIQVNSTLNKWYRVFIDEADQLSLRPYHITKGVFLDRYFPAKLGEYSCITSDGDTIISLDWKTNSVPFIKTDTREIFYIRYENEKYNLLAIPF